MIIAVQVEANDWQVWLCQGCEPGEGNSLCIGSGNTKAKALRKALAYFNGMAAACGKLVIEAERRAS